jgi:hypothetical protein
MTVKDGIMAAPIVAVLAFISGVCIVAHGYPLFDILNHIILVLFLLWFVSGLFYFLLKLAILLEGD